MPKTLRVVNGIRLFKTRKKSEKGRQHHPQQPAEAAGNPCVMKAWLRAGITTRLPAGEAGSKIGRSKRTDGVNSNISRGNNIRIHATAALSINNNVTSCRGPRPRPDGLRGHPSLNPQHVEGVRGGSSNNNDTIQPAPNGSTINNTDSHIVNTVPNISKIPKASQKAENERMKNSNTVLFIINGRHATPIGRRTNINFTPHAYSTNVNIFVSGRQPALNGLSILINSRQRTRNGPRSIIIINGRKPTPNGPRKEEDNSTVVGISIATHADTQALNGLIPIKHSPL